MTARFHCEVAVSADSDLLLPAGAARHVQVLRMQPGDALTLFDGHGGEYAATVERMGRSEVAVRVGAHAAVEREAGRAIHLAVGMPANERMDWLVEKATELGAASVQPLMTAHGVLRLNSERADKKRAHWEAIAIAACEQCGRNRVPRIHPVRTFGSWLEGFQEKAERFILSLAPGTRALADARAAADRDAWVLSGPEGGLSAAEEQAAMAQGFAPLTLGPRVLRAETAALAALVGLAGG
ncbi:16S rRNA (uracil(1498)-N(3))-methyltransferase [Variovorax saccharolyticus]|uniref:16S rRNA (uracil(1498)-N(3))-methyltransferase n=1 Tax=Variovorax saccharolyticus TaxID=3053516 RepID=UPI002578324B|nr:16S rRNA (uracil(1498)-N(3))-methyltransferase [Variovorax sp. J22R187]MDM0021521.1 16S rRNA (uracil(1498)-N(3))-methyltransferase [Variovorax sp. J22R187]